MKKNISRISLTVCLLFLITCCYAQMMIPASLAQRTTNAKKIAIGKVIQKHSYWDANHHNIWTINLMEVQAYLKNDVSNNSERIAIITSGGIVGNEGQVTCPSYEFNINQEYVVFLEADNQQVDDKNYRRNNPSIPQCEPYASSQGVFGYVDGKYHDLLTESPMTEVDFVNRLSSNFNLSARTPDNRPYVARTIMTESGILLGSISTWANGAGTSNSSGNYIGATIVADNELIISGAGFGAVPGSVEFDHVDDGLVIGGFGYAATIPSDIISWSDVQIRTRIPSKAGTGIFRVKDNAAAVVAVSPSNINIIWSQINVVSNAVSFSANTRQQAKFINQDNLGGYTFQYSTVTASGNTFSTNNPAKAAFERALNTWRCTTRVNFTVGATTTSVGPANDDINSVSFNPALAANVLGSCITRFSAQGLAGVCDFYNTLWYVKELDIQMSPNGASFGWNYGTGPTAGTGLIDFETVMLHEIGHGHSCDHINTPALSMYYAVSTNTDKRTLTANEITCGAFRVSNSTSPFCVSSLGGGEQPMVLITAPPNLGPDVTLYKNCVGETTDLTTLFNTSGLTANWNTGSPTVAPPGIYQLTAANTYGCTDIALANVILEVATWTGSISNDWHNPANWNINKVPTAQTHVIVPGGTPNQCHVSTANATAASIQVRSGGTVQSSTSRTITVSGVCLTLPTN